MSSNTRIQSIRTIEILDSRGFPAPVRHGTPPGRYFGHGIGALLGRSLGECASRSVVLLPSTSWRLSSGKVARDHAYVFIRYRLTHKVSQIMQWLKSTSSRAQLQEYSHLGGGNY